MEEIFILLSDLSGTTRSIDEPIGIAVKTEKEAKKFLKANYGYSDSYQKIKIIDSIDDFLKKIENHKKQMIDRWSKKSDLSKEDE